MEKKHELLLTTLVALGAAVGIVAIFLLESLTSPNSSSFCNTSSDCLNLTQGGCPGRWVCANHYCMWECKGVPQSCIVAGDCIGDLSEECRGRWNCVEGKCEWVCEREGRVGLEYNVGGCEKGTRGIIRSPGVSIASDAGGIRIKQNLSYVCCADIRINATEMGKTIRIVEKNVGSMCRCMCNYDIDARVRVAPGTYHVEVYGVQFGNKSPEMIAEETVVVGRGEGRILFVERRTNRTGRVIYGEYPYSFRVSDSYHFDPDRRILEGGGSIELENAIAIYGKREELGGDLGRGVVSRLYPVYSLPVEVGEDKIISVDYDGTVELLHLNTTIRLSPGERWNKTTTEETSGPYQTGIIEITTSEIIENHGFIERGRII